MTQNLRKSFLREPETAFAFVRCSSNCPESDKGTKSNKKRKNIESVWRKTVLVIKQALDLTILCSFVLIAQVCENGQILMDLDTAIRHPQFLPASWSMQPTLFAPYWCLADNSYSKTLRPGVRSHVWYHEYKISPLITSSERQMLKAISSLVYAKYHLNWTSSFQFRARWALVATWERISPYPSTYRYQVVSYHLCVVNLGRSSESLQLVQGWNKCAKIN